MSGGADIARSAAIAAARLAEGGMTGPVVAGKGMRTEGTAQGGSPVVPAARGPLAAPPSTTLPSTTLPSTTLSPALTDASLDAAPGGAPRVRADANIPMPHAVPGAPADAAFAATAHEPAATQGRPATSLPSRPDGASATSPAAALARAAEDAPAGRDALPDRLEGVAARADHAAGRTAREGHDARPASHTLAALAPPRPTGHVPTTHAPTRHALATDTPTMDALMRTKSTSAAPTLASAAPAAVGHPSPAAAHAVTTDGDIPSPSVAVTQPEAATRGAAASEPATDRAAVTTVVSARDVPAREAVMREAPMRAGEGPVAPLPSPDQALPRASPDASPLHEALAVLLASAADSGSRGMSGGVPGGVLGAVILNAAMLPGWPYPRALEGALAGTTAAGARGASPLVADAAGALDMSPQEMIDYLMSLGAHARLLDRLRRLFGRIEAREVKALLGFLAALVSALRTIETALAGDEPLVMAGAERNRATGRHALRI